MRTKLCLVEGIIWNNMEMTALVQDAKSQPTNVYRFFFLLLHLSMLISLNKVPIFESYLKPLS